MCEWCDFYFYPVIILCVYVYAMQYVSKRPYKAVYLSPLHVNAMSHNISFKDLGLFEFLKP